MTEKRKILLVSNGFYPEISPRSFRATELAKEFCRQGHDVTVISKFRNFNYEVFLKEHPVTFKMWRKPVFPKVKEFRQKHLSVISRIFTRALLTLFEYPGIEEMFMVRNILKDEGGYDLIISFAVPYPVHWGVAWSRTDKHRIADTWVADCGDPYMGDVLDSFRKPFYFGYLEKLFCRKADFISIPVESARPGYYSEFHKKIRIITQGFEFDLKKGNQHDPLNEIPTFAYAGGFLPGARDPKPMLNLLIEIDLPFRFLIFTNMPEFIDEFKEKLGEKLKISGYIPRNELMKVLSEMDFLVNFDNNTTLNSPSKLIDYAITNRPVINISQNIDKEGLMAFLKGDYRSRMLLPDPEQFHIKNVSKQFIDLII